VLDRKADDLLIRPMPRAGSPGAPGPDQQSHGGAGLPALTFIVGEDCNATCVYCYQERGASRAMSRATARLAVEAFAPRLAGRARVHFYGGEPLLHTDLMRGIVDDFEKRGLEKRSRLRFGVTTNGLLIDEKTADFLDRRHFSVVLSHDGPAQEITRPSTRAGADAALDRLLRKRRLRLEVNSVFTPRTVGSLAAAAEEFLKRGAPALRISLDLFRPWSAGALRCLRTELARVRETAGARTKTAHPSPVLHEREDASAGFSACSGGRSAMSVSPDGRIWGCYLAADWARRKPGRETEAYCFGRLRALEAPSAAPNQDVLRRYAALSMATLRVDGAPCALCPDVRECGVCPMVPALAGYPLGTIPRYLCEIRKIQIEDRRLRRLRRLNRAGVNPAAAR